MSRGHKPGNDDDDVMRVLRALSSVEKKMVDKMPIANKKENVVIKGSKTKTGNSHYDAEKN